MLLNTEEKVKIVIYMLPILQLRSCREGVHWAQLFLSSGQCFPGLQTSRREESKDNLSLYFDVDINSFVYFCRNFSKEQRLALISFIGALLVNIT